MEGHSSSALALLSLLLLAILHSLPTSAARVIYGPQGSEDESTTFIKARCASTTYPQLCVDSLSPHAAAIHTDPVLLAKTALSLSLSSARSASDLVSALLEGGKTKAPREAAAMKDCVENMAESVDELRRSAEAMEQLGGEEKAKKRKSVVYQMDNVRTWVSAAITDEDTCMDGVAAGKGISGETRSAVRAHVVKVAQLTSNALALLNGL